MRKKSNIKNTSEQIFRLTIIHFFWHKIDNISPSPRRADSILQKIQKKHVLLFSGKLDPDGPPFTPPGYIGLSPYPYHSTPLVSQF